MQRMSEVKLFTVVAAAIIGSVVLVTAIWGDVFREPSRPASRRCACACACAAAAP